MYTRETAYRDGARVTEFPIGSYLLEHYPERKPDKFSTRMRGPLQVVNQLGNKYTVQNLVTQKQYDVFIKRLVPFHYDPERVDPQEIARKDEREKGIPQRRLEMKFLVRWAGFGPEDDTWEPWENLRNPDQLHDYLRANRMKSLIPQHARHVIA